MVVCGKSRFLELHGLIFGEHTEGAANFKTKSVDLKIEETMSRM